MDSRNQERKGPMITLFGLGLCVILFAAGCGMVDMLFS